MTRETLITKLALEAGLLNYVDNETPRRYFIDGHAHNEEVEKFAELIIRECVDRIKRVGILEDIENETDMVVDAVKEHFGVE